MKSLICSIINEVEIDDQISFIRATIDSPEEQAKVIKQMYMAGNAELKQMWASFAASKNYNQTQADAIYKILMDAGAIELLQGCLANDGIIEPDLILNQLNTPQSLLDLILNSIPPEYEFDKSCIPTLISCQPGAGGVAVGPGELLLSFIVKSCKQNGGAADKKKSSDENNASNDEISGDLKMGKYGVEIKGNQCLFAGQKGQPDGKKFRDNFQKQFPDIDLGKAATTPWEKYFPEMLKRMDNAKHSALSELVIRLCDGYYQDRGQIVYGDLIFDIDAMNPSNGKEFLLALAVAGLKSYWRIEKFDRILFINNSKNKSPRCLLIDASMNMVDLYKLFKQNFKVDTAIDPKDKHKVLPKLTMIG